jgi:hypothetical protein
MSAEFMQTLPSGNWTLTNPDKRAGQLRYREVETGVEIVVPSIWYNQPVAWRADYFRFCAQRNREGAERLRGMKDAFRHGDADQMIAQALRLEEAASTMDRTGRFVSLNPNGGPR